MTNDSFYQQTIMELARRRRDDSPLTAADAIHSKRHNPLCGDSITLSLTTNNREIIAVSQQVRGCLLCSAATQQMLDIIAANKNSQQLLEYCTAAESMFASGNTPPMLTMFLPVIAHPARHECILLPFRALSDILQPKNLIA